MKQELYPKEYFIKFEGESYLEGRITLLKTTQGFNAEIDVVQKSSRKIFKHLGAIYKIEDETDALNQAVWELKNRLK